MAKKVKTYLFPGAAYVLNLLSALFWVALRINYSGISKFLGADTNQSFLIMNLPIMACVLAWVGFALALAGLICWEKKKLLSICGMVIGAITVIGGAVVVYFGARDYLQFIMVHFWKSLAVAAGLTGLGLLLFLPVTSRSKAVLAVKTAVLALSVLLAVVLGYQLRGCDFTYGAVVYAVEDTYQIVFSTSDSAVGWVTIGGEDYYDLYAGSARSVDRVHKVTVPQAALDAAGAYEIHAQQMIYRGPFGGYKGETISRSYEFRPVDTSDGLNYVSLSDVHSAYDAAVKAARVDGLDFVVLIGDLVSMVETEEDAQAANRVAHAITGGSIPVIYARGNHEIKGEYAEVLYKYVGSLNQSFAYTVTLGEKDVFAVVMDMGEDHEDDWWEYYGTAHFDLYRQEQTEMLEELVEAGTCAEYRYRMAVCHIPIVHIDSKGYFASFRQEWTRLLNELDMDIALSGHKHKVYQYLQDTHIPGETLVYSEAYAGKTGKEEGGTVTDFRFPTFLVGQRSLAQTGGTQKVGLTDYLCLHTSVDLAGGTQSGFYRNSLGEAVSIVYPFVPKAGVEVALDGTMETPLK